jgi:hypothetical protein
MPQKHYVAAPGRLAAVVLAHPLQLSSRMDLNAQRELFEIALQELAGASAVRRH